MCRLLSDLVHHLSEVAYDFRNLIHLAFLLSGIAYEEFGTTLYIACVFLDGLRDQLYAFQNATDFIEHHINRFTDGLKLLMTQAHTFAEIATLNWLQFCAQLGNTFFQG